MSTMTADTAKVTTETTTVVEEVVAKRPKKVKRVKASKKVKMRKRGRGRRLGRWLRRRGEQMRAAAGRARARMKVIAKRAAKLAKKASKRAVNMLKKGASAVARGARSAGRGVSRTTRAVGRFSWSTTRAAGHYTWLGMAWTGRGASWMFRTVLESVFDISLAAVVVLALVTAGLAVTHDKYEATVHRQVRAATGDKRKKTKGPLGARKAKSETGHYANEAANRVGTWEEAIVPKGKKAKVEKIEVKAQKGKKAKGKKVAPVVVSKKGKHAKVVEQPAEVIEVETETVVEKKTTPLTETVTETVTETTTEVVEDDDPNDPLNLPNFGLTDDQLIDTWFIREPVIPTIPEVVRDDAEYMDSFLRLIFKLDKPIMLTQLEIPRPLLLETERGMNLTDNELFQGRSYWQGRVDAHGVIVRYLQGKLADYENLSWSEVEPKVKQAFGAGWASLARSAKRLHDSRELHMQKYKEGYDHQRDWSMQLLQAEAGVSV